MLHTAAEACRARVIAVDRPGFGASPFSPQHSVANWAGMVQVTGHASLDMHQHGSYAAASADLCLQCFLTPVGIHKVLNSQMHHDMLLTQQCYAQSQHQLCA
jgi:pimeloyl-ACP methyl ester carboxylesterase